MVRHGKIRFTFSSPRLLKDILPIDCNVKRNEGAKDDRAKNHKVPRSAFYSTQESQVKRPLTLLSQKIARPEGLRIVRCCQFLYSSS